MPDIADVILILTRTIGYFLMLCSFLEFMEIIDLAFHWNRVADKRRLPDLQAATNSQPIVSLHVPLRAEPVAVVEKTLKSIAALNYEHFEVVVVYNNTSDPTLWEPISSLCTELGPRFKFHFVRKLPGFKAGALNFALRNSEPNAKIIGVIDADYVVDSDYLSSIVPFFLDKQVAFVQSPQDNRDSNKNSFTKSCYWEYWQFFEVGMAIRSMRNATMLHGTMSLIRKQALIEAGGWAEWCVTEDSELGLRLLTLGYQSHYVKTTYGRGLLPFSFGDYKRQRWRWVAGGAQQLRHHFWELTTGRQLSIGQKAHHLQGWLPWFRDALIIASQLILGLASVQAILTPDRALVPLIILGSGVLSVVIHQVVRQVIIYRLRLGLPWSKTVGASLAVMSLTMTIGLAFIFALFGRRTPFSVTPKVPDSGVRWGRDVVVELASGAYLAMLTLMLVTVYNGSTSSAVYVPLLYIPLIMPAYAMSFMGQSTRARDSEPNKKSVCPPEN